MKVKRTDERTDFVPYTVTIAISSPEDEAAFDELVLWGITIYKTKTKK